MRGLKLGLGALAILAAITGLVVQRQAQNRLLQENQALRQQIAQLQSNIAGLAKREARTPFWRPLRTPSMQVALPTNTPTTEDSPSTNLYARFKDHRPHLSAEQVEAYLKANGRKPGSLLAA